MFCQYPLAELVNLNLSNARHTRTFKTQVETTNTGKHADELHGSTPAHPAAHTRATRMTRNTQIQAMLVQIRLNL